MAEEHSPGNSSLLLLLYESSSVTPHGHEFWFVNHDPSQRVYVRLEASDDAPTTSSEPSSSLAWKIADTLPLPEHENEECSVPVDKENVSFLTDALSSHLRTHPARNRKRIGFTLTRDGVFEEHPPPALSDNAVWSPPDDVVRVPLGKVKVLETREIRPNVRIARLSTTGERCIFKTVEFRSEAVGLSFEVSNYKSLMGKGCGGWIPRLLALAYIHDDEGKEGKEVSKEDAENVHFVGAAFEFFPQKDLTQHYASASTTMKLSWLHQLVAAVSALENAGFEHWDLKCENVVLDTSPLAPPTTQPGERRGSITSHHPSENEPGRIKIIDLENNKASSAWKVTEKDISMVYSMGKTVLEMFLGRVPDVGDVNDSDLEGLPDVARAVVEMCCRRHGREEPTAKEVLEKVKGMLST